MKNRFQLRLVPILLTFLCTVVGGLAQDTPSAAAEDDDFGTEPAKPTGDDDFGTEPAKPTGDDDFGTEPASGDDDFGSDDAEKKPDEEEEAEEKPKEFTTAAEAHLTFLKALESENRFPSAATCASCHPDHYREWSVSAHAYSQMSPVFNTMHAAIVDRTAGTNGDFCIRCHTQIGMQRDEPLFTSNLNRHPASIEGITCVVCHRVNKNYGKVSGRTHIQAGDIFTTMYGPQGSAILMETLAEEELKKKLNPLRVDPETGEPFAGKKDLHATIEKFDPIATSGFCGSCHDVNLLNGFRLEEAFSQFKNSPAADKEQNCQDCHMGKVPGAVATTIDKRLDPAAFVRENYRFGPGARIDGDLWAVEGKPETGKYGFATTPRKRTNHMFVGPDYSIIHPAIFPHSQDLRQAFWETTRELESGKYERVGLAHLIEFKYEKGWGDSESAFEKSMVEDPDKEKGLPWPWDDPIVRLTMAEKLNDNFKLLNAINTQRVQILRRGVQLHNFEVIRNDNRGMEFRIKVVNGTDGHGVPTGFDAERLAFLEVKVTDAKGRVVFKSGDRDPNGDIRDLHSSYVHAEAEKTGDWLAESDWKTAAGLKRMRDDEKWLEDPFLFNLQSKFLTRNHRGGEREQILAVNYSIDPLPYIRPDTRPGILVARPAAARKQARILPPNGHRWADYKIKPSQLTGDAPYEISAKFVWQMVPVNLVKEISDQGFDYNLSPAEVARRVAFGHKMPDGTRRGGAITTWERSIKIGQSEAPTADWKPSEEDILAEPTAPFPWRDPAEFGGIEGGISLPTELGDLPAGEGGADASKLTPKPSESKSDDSFE
ncbi:MAG: nitrate/TMAO reductase-like tetraheme cytochrome c subunit [Verrucomicrobiales bacterium]|jgi:nitrate/TMAO reductase-like tetraheme cytochrome c subunit